MDAGALATAPARANAKDGVSQNGMITSAAAQIFNDENGKGESWLGKTVDNLVSDLTPSDATLNELENTANALGPEGGLAVKGGEAAAAGIAELADEASVAAEDTQALIEDGTLVRTEPQNLSEQLTMEEAKNNPGQEIMQGQIRGPAYPGANWAKMQYVHRPLDSSAANITTHYWENRLTGEKEGFKFKD